MIIYFFNSHISWSNCTLKGNQFMFSLKIYKRNTIFFNNLCFLYTNINLMILSQFISKYILKDTIFRMNLKADSAIY